MSLKSLFDLRAVSKGFKQLHKDLTPPNPRHESALYKQERATTDEMVDGLILMVATGGFGGMEMATVESPTSALMPSYSPDEYSVELPETTDEMMALQEAGEEIIGAVLHMGQESGDDYQYDIRYQSRPDTISNIYPGGTRGGQIGNLASGVLSKLVWRPEGDIVIVDGPFNAREIGIAEDRSDIENTTENGPVVDNSWIQQTAKWWIYKMEEFVKLAYARGYRPVTPMNLGLPVIFVQGSVSSPMAIAVQTAIQGLLPK